MKIVERPKFERPKYEFQPPPPIPTSFPEGDFAEPSDPPLPPPPPPENLTSKIETTPIEENNSTLENENPSENKPLTLEEQIKLKAEKSTAGAIEYKVKLVKNPILENLKI